jgi:polygalacturonase
MNLRLIACLALGLLRATAARSAGPGEVFPLVPLIPDHTVRLAEFGAVGDGAASNTDAFKRAVAAVEQAGGGTLVVDPGVYLTGPIALCSRINLRLAAGATIRFSTRPADYASQGRRLQPQLGVDGRHDVMISGAGTFDGQGAAWWPAARAMRDPVTGRQINGQTTPRPPLIVVNRCRQVRVEGVNLVNSPALNLGIVDSEDVAVDGVSIVNPPDSPNTDGIDPKGARRVVITRCRIDTGDDCIAGGGGRSGVEEDILITDCVFRHGHGCSIGSGTTGGVRNFVVRRCSFEGTETGIRLKSYRGHGGRVENLLFEDLTMHDVGHAITLNSHYEGTTTDTMAPAGEPAEPVTSTTPEWRRIVVRRVSAVGCRLDAGLIAGLPEMPVQNLVLDQVSIDAPTGLRLGFADTIVLHHVQILARTGPALILGAGVVHLTQD